MSDSEAWAGEVAHSVAHGDILVTFREGRCKRKVNARKFHKVEKHICRKNTHCY